MATDDPPLPQRTRFRAIAILIALYLVLFIAALDQTIIATAIPSITSQLHSASGYTWIGSAYNLANAAAGPIWAKGSDIWGRKPALLGAVTMFGAASIIAALSINMAMLIAARALQGVAGGGLMQLVIITISDLYSPRKRTLYYGFCEVVWAVAGGAGPVFGGLFTQLVTWRWCFWINLPICGIALGLLILLLDVHNPRTRIRDGLLAVDWPGTLSLLAVTVMLLLGLDFGGAIFPWNSLKVICLIVIGTAMIGFFLFSEKRLAKYPLIPLKVFDGRSNISSFIVGWMHGMVFIAVEYYMPLYFQSAKQASPLKSGVLILPITISEALSGLMVGIVLHRFGRYREIIWAGLALLTLGTGLFIMFTARTAISTLVGLEILYGTGAGLLFTAPIIAIQNTVSQANTGSATATFGFLRNVATSISLVIGGVVFQNGMAAQVPSLRSVGLDTDVLESLSGGRAAAHVDIVQTIANTAQQNAVKEAFALSFREMWIMYTALAGIGLFAGLFVEQNDLRKEHTETKTGLHNLSQRDPAT